MSVGAPVSAKQLHPLPGLSHRLPDRADDRYSGRYLSKRSALGSVAGHEGRIGCPILPFPLPGCSPRSMQSHQDIELYRHGTCYVSRCLLSETYIMLPLILIVEDEVLLADSIAIYLKCHAYATAVAYTGEDGLRLAAENNPDVAVVDLRLPGLDGLNVLRHLREVSPG